jgi:transcriptional regulator with XRE-family HTH domain
MEQVRHKRILLNMSQGSLALAIGSTQAFISKWELGKEMPGCEAKQTLLEWSGYGPDLQTSL